MKRSTGLLNTMLVGSSFTAAMNGSVVRVYGGTPPATADAALTGDAVLLLTYSVDGDGTGVTFDTVATDRTVQKNPSEIWLGSVTTSGTATFFRMQKPSDTNTASSSAPRLQGTVGLADTDLEVSDTTFTVGDERKLNYFSVSIAAG